MPGIVLVRHGQANFGGDDYDVLSEVGMRQAALAREALDERGIAPSVVISGSLRRQRGTAAAWTDAPIVDPRWDEYSSDDVLRAHGDPTTSLERPGDSRVFQAMLDVALTDWIAAGVDSPAAVSFPTFTGHVEAALGELAAGLGSGETALVATSGGVIAAVVVAVLGLPPDRFVGFNRVTVNAAFTKLVIGRSGTTLVSFNEHAHLDRAALVTYR